ncbi:MAG: fatty acid desaturase [Pseudomonadales bacterium]|nr:fatty acid desaturase [Pseudomonadales bacterium]MCP5186100.1 fatty acid desaturase [Pseudomonadales bacterium]
MLSHGLLNLSLPALILTVFVLTHITVLAVTIYLHRFSAHRALWLHPALQHFFRLWLWLGTGMVTKEWTAVHRKHHAECETEEDPHSPVVMGINKILWDQAGAYRVAAAKTEILDRYGSGTPDDWLERNLYRHSFLGISITFIIDVLLFGVIGITVWALQMVCIPFVGGIINGIGHFWGYRNFEPADASRNISPVGFLIGGEELHNNHHTYPNSAKLSFKPWEFDIGWFWISLFRALGLAKPYSTGPVIARTDEARLDRDTARALLNDRFNVMATYAKTVVAPLVREKQGEANEATRKLLRRAHRLLCRDESLLNDSHRRQLADIVEVPDLKTVYELRLRLQAIWAKRSGNLEEVVSALRQWCQDAEASGLDTLRQFVEELKRYTVPPRLAPA